MPWGRWGTGAGLLAVPPCQRLQFTARTCWERVFVQLRGFRGSSAPPVDSERLEGVLGGHGGGLQRASICPRPRLVGLHTTLPLASLREATESATVSKS